MLDSKRSKRSKKAGESRERPISRDTYRENGANRPRRDATRGRTARVPTWSSPLRSKIFRARLGSSIASTSTTPVAGGLRTDDVVRYVWRLVNGVAGLRAPLACHLSPLTALLACLATGAPAVTVADEIMSILCDESRHVVDPNKLVGSYFSPELPDISPDDQQPVENEDSMRLGTNSYSWRAVLFGKPWGWERRSALQLSEAMGRVRYAVRAAETGERIDVSLDMRLEECLRPAYRRLCVEEAWCLVSILGESDDDRGPEALVRRRLGPSDKVLTSVQVSPDRNMMVVGRDCGGQAGDQEGGREEDREGSGRRVFVYASRLVDVDDADDDGDHDGDADGEGRPRRRWSLTSVDALS